MVDKKQVKYEKNLEELIKKATQYYENELRDYYIEQQKKTESENECLRIITDDKLYYLNKNMLNRFFIAREEVVDKSFEMWRDWVLWHVKCQPQKITFEEVEDILKEDRIFIYNSDKDGRPSAFVPAQNIGKSKDIEKIIRMHFYIVENLIRIGEDRGHDKFIIIYDVRTLEYSQFNSFFKELTKAILDKLQNYYPERLYKLFLIECDFITRTCYKVIKLFMNKKTAEKIELFDKVDKLKQYYNDDALPISCGGTCQINVTFNEIYQNRQTLQQNNNYSSQNNNDNQNQEFQQQQQQQQQQMQESQNQSDNFEEKSTLSELQLNLIDKK